MIYPVIFTETHDEKNTYLIYIPDLNGMTEGYGLEDAINMARDYIGCTICGKAEDEMPKPSSIGEVRIEDSEFAGRGESFITLVDFDMEKYDSSKLMQLSKKFEQFAEESGMDDNKTDSDKTEQQEYRVIQIEGCVEVPCDVTEDGFLDKFIRFIEDNHWYFGGGVQMIDDEEEKSEDQESEGD